MKYHYTDQNNVPIAPYEIGDLLRLHAQGRVQPETYVLAEGATTWQPFATVLAQQRPAASLPPPPTASPLAAKPAKVQAIAIMSLVSGILNCVGGLGWLMAGLFMFLIGVVFTIIPAAYLLVVGILDIVYASNLMGASTAPVRPARHLAILNIVSIIFLNLIPCALGIANLVFYGDEETQRFFGNRSS